jgi:TrmH family RNA methyltransferase
MFIEGKRLVDEAIRSGIRVEKCFISDRFAGGDYVALPDGAHCFAISDKLIDSIADTENSQGVIFLGRRSNYDLDRIDNDLKGSAIAVVIYLDRINNPSNLGAVIRGAEAAGAAGVVTSPSSADAFSPKAVRASMGSAFRLPIVQGVDLGLAFRWAKETGLVLTAADIRADTVHTDIDWTTPRLVVLGSEAHGLSDEALDMIDQLVRIPIEPSVESLNLAVSAGILLFEARRQKGISG